MNVVILAAGDFPTHEIPLRTLREADIVVCCDNAYNGWKREREERGNKKSFVVIGDGDSLSDADKDALGDLYIHVDEQDYNDLHKAMRWATDHYPLSANHFTILGATGRREDHTLGNISYLVTFAEEYPGADIKMLTDYGRLEAFRGRRTFDSFPRQQVSLFSMEPDKTISADGLRWPLDDFQARRWWQATLNEALGNAFTLQSNGWLVLFRTYEPKG